MAIYNVFDSDSPDDIFNRVYYAKVDVQYLLVEQAESPFVPGRQTYFFAGLEDGNEWITFNLWRTFDSGNNLVGALNDKPDFNGTNVYEISVPSNVEEIWCTPTGYMRPKAFGYSYGYELNNESVEYIYNRIKPIDTGETGDNGGPIWKYPSFSLPQNFSNYLIFGGNSFFNNQGEWKIGDIFGGIGVSPYDAEGDYVNYNPGVDPGTLENFISGIITAPSFGGLLGTNLYFVFGPQKVSMGNLNNLGLTPVHKTSMMISHPCDDKESYDIYLRSQFINYYSTEFGIFDFVGDNTNLNIATYDKVNPFGKYSSSGVFPWTVLYPAYFNSGITPSVATENNLLTTYSFGGTNGTLRGSAYNVQGLQTVFLDPYGYREDIVAYIQYLQQFYNLGSGAIDSVLNTVHPITQELILSTAPTSLVTTYIANIPNSVRFNIALNYPLVSNFGLPNTPNNIISGLIYLTDYIFSVSSGISYTALDTNILYNQQTYYGIYSLYLALFGYDGIQAGVVHSNAFPTMPLISGDIYYLNETPSAGGGNPNRQDWRDSILYTQPGYTLLSNSQYLFPYPGNNYINFGSWTSARRHLLTISFGADSNTNNWYNATSVANGDDAIVDRFTNQPVSTHYSGIGSIFGAYINGWVNAPIDEIPPYILTRDAGLPDNFSVITYNHASGVPGFVGPPNTGIGYPAYGYTNDFSFQLQYAYQTVTQDQLNKYCFPVLNYGYGTTI